jgi:hydroxymethylglutaryl-CoA reductase
LYPAEPVQAPLFAEIIEKTAMDRKNSRLSGFYKLAVGDRLDALSDWLSPEEQDALSGKAGLGLEQADHMIENVIGVHALPLGVALNFVVNGRDVLVPMAIEEPSVVAGASFMARLVREGGGFIAQTTPPEMIGQMQVLDVPDLPAARQALLEQKEELLAAAAEIDPGFAEPGWRAARLAGAVDRRFAASARSWSSTLSTMCAMQWAPMLSTPP